MPGMFGDDEPDDPRREPQEQKVSHVGPGGMQFPHLLGASILIGVVVAPIGALMAAIVAFMSNGWNQKTWRGAFIVLATVLILATIFELYLLAPGEDAEGPPGGEGVQG